MVGVCLITPGSSKVCIPSLWAHVLGDKRQVPVLAVQHQVEQPLIQQAQMEYDLLFIHEPLSASLPIWTTHASNRENTARKLVIKQLFQAPPKVPQDVVDLQLLEVHEH